MPLDSGSWGCPAAADSGFTHSITAVGEPAPLAINPCASLVPVAHVRPLSHPLPYSIEARQGSPPAGTLNSRQQLLTGTDDDQAAGNLWPIVVRAEGGGRPGHRYWRAAWRGSVAGVVLPDQRLRVCASGPGDGADVPARIEVSAAGGEVVPFDPPDDRLPDPGPLADLCDGETRLVPCCCQGLTDADAAPPLPDRAAARPRRGDRCGIPFSPDPPEGTPAKRRHLAAIRREPARSFRPARCQYVANQRLGRCRQAAARPAHGQAGYRKPARRRS
jgi:hypothetical protein